MPYIKQEERTKLIPAILQLHTDLSINENKKGNLNYAITKLIHLHLEKVGKRYDTLSDITGVLHDVVTEWDRKVVAIYEEEKIKQNGDI